MKTSGKRVKCDVCGKLNSNRVCLDSGWDIVKGKIICGECIISSLKRQIRDLKKERRA